MPKTRCGFGFNCASMMMQPGLDAGNCPNYHTCGSALDFSLEERLGLYLVREEERQQYREQIFATRGEIALMMLTRRGCPQTTESLGVSQLVLDIESRLTQLRSRLSQYGGQYIAPLECEAHRYNVKRPWGTYWYNKLTASEAIFEPSERDTRVRVIHLSRDDDPRNQEARAGIERRNQFTKLKTQLQLAEQTLVAALELLPQVDV